MVQLVSETPDLELNWSYTIESEVIGFNSLCFNLIARRVLQVYQAVEIAVKSLLYASVS